MRRGFRLALCDQADNRWVMAWNIVDGDYTEAISPIRCNHDMQACIPDLKTPSAETPLAFLINEMYGSQAISRRAQINFISEQ